MTPEEETKFILSNFIKSELNIIINYYDIESWYKKLPLALEPNALKMDASNKFKVEIKNEPLVSFMLSDIFGIIPEHMGFGGAMFPCMHMESYALALLDMCDDDDICELNITGLVHSGWVDDFYHIEQVQKGRTVFLIFLKMHL
ncbi:HEPN/Toprim-associated domain-containing protein [Aeromonas hydrophila]|uniref:HEPN/Toprim-associated domain-containing protein n=1 Tax=Aeromonas hydrophila TaxID=644 RepID=UPI003D961E5B